MSEAPITDTEAESPADTGVSAEPYQELNRELDPEMEAKRDELRAKGAEVAEVKWGTKTPIPFTEYSTGNNTEIRCNGTFTYFPEANEGMDEETLKAYVVESMSSVILHRSGYLDAEQLPAETNKMRDEVIAKLANEYGILLDRIVIISVTKPQETKQAETKPAENVSNGVWFDK